MYKTFTPLLLIQLHIILTRREVELVITELPLNCQLTAGAMGSPNATHTSKTVEPTLKVSLGVVTTIAMSDGSMGS